MMIFTYTRMDNNYKRYSDLLGGGEVSPLPLPPNRLNPDNKLIFINYKEIILIAKLVQALFCALHAANDKDMPCNDDFNSSGQKYKIQADL